MPKKVKLVIDSVVEDRIRILITTEDKEKEILDIDIQSLKRLLKGKSIDEGRSYSITFKDSDDYAAMVSEKIDEQFKSKGELDVTVKDTTRSDEAAIRRLQKKLGLKI